MPKAVINTISEVFPQLISGKGNPVGGILPVTTSALISA